MLRRFRSFHRGIVSLLRSKGFKFVVCQTLKMIPSSGSQTQAASMWLESGGAAEFFFRPPTLTAHNFFDLQKPTVSVWKDLNLLNINLTQSHLRAYLLYVPHLFSETVCKNLTHFKRLPNLELPRRNQNSCKINKKWTIYLCLLSYWRNPQTTWLFFSSHWWVPWEISGQN